MGILRVHKKGNYTVMSNHHLDNQSLSLESKGLMSFMLSKKDDWEFTVSGLSAQLKEGKRKILNIISKLSEEGYITRESVKEKGRYSKVVYNVYEVPVSPCVEKPHAEKPHAEFPHAEKSTQVNTELEVSTEEEVNTEYISQPFLFSEFWEQYGLKRGRASSEKVFSKLKPKELEKIKNTLGIYISETTTNMVPGERKIYRANPLTYLRQKRWEDYDEVAVSHIEVDYTTCRGREIPDTFFLKNFRCKKESFIKRDGEVSLEGFSGTWFECLEFILSKNYNRKEELKW